METLTFIANLLPAIITTAIAYYLQRSQKKRDARNEERAKARKEESLLSLDLTMSNAKLSYACAMALKRGSANGEVEDAIDDYEKAKSAYYKFLNGQATERLHEK